MDADGEVGNTLGILLRDLYAKPSGACQLARKQQKRRRPMSLIHAFVLNYAYQCYDTVKR